MPLQLQADTSTNSIFELSLEELGNISVASLFDEQLLEVSSSVKVINEQDWQANGARRTNEIMTYQPSSVAYPFLGGSNVFAVRGYSNSLSARGIATLLDGVPLNTYSYGTAQYFLVNFDIGAVQRAELIRGPGSAIYGSDAFHGVFSLETFAVEKDSVETELGLGSPEYARGHVRFSQSIGDKQRLNGAAAITRQGDGEISFDTSDADLQGEREDAFVSKTTYLKSAGQLNEDWQTEWGVYYNQWKGDKFASFGEEILGVNDVSDSEQSFYMMQGKASYSWNKKSSLEIKTFFWKVEQRFEYIFEPVPLQAQEDRRYGLSVIYKNAGDEHTTRWLVGIGTDKTEIVASEIVGGVQAFDGLERSVNNIFAEIRAPLMDNKLLFNVATRIDDYSAFDAHFTPRLGLVYKRIKNEAIKLLYGRAFRAPVASEISSSGKIQGNPELEPETIDTYELIWMKQSYNSYFSATAFISHWHDAINIVADTNLAAPFDSKYENQGQLSSRGIELEASSRLKNWKIDAAYSYVESVNEETDTDFNAFPTHIVQLGLTRQVNSSLDFRLYNTAYFDVYANADEFASKLGTIWQSNINMNYQWSQQTSLTIDIRNLFNRKDPVPSLWGNEQGLPVEGAQASVYMRMKF